MYSTHRYIDKLNRNVFLCNFRTTRVLYVGFFPWCIRKILHPWGKIELDFHQFPCKIISVICSLHVKYMLHLLMHISVNTKWKAAYLPCGTDQVFESSFCASEILCLHILWPDLPPTIVIKKEKEKKKKNTQGAAPLKLDLYMNAKHFFSNEAACWAVLFEIHTPSVQCCWNLSQRVYIYISCGSVLVGFPTWIWYSLSERLTVNCTQGSVDSYCISPIYVIYIQL